MQGKRYSIIGLVLFMTVMLTGMCFEDIRTDSFFAYVRIEESSLRLVVPDESVDIEQLCTIQMLDMQEPTEMQELTNGLRKHRSEEEADFDIFSLDIYAKELGKDSPGDRLYSANNENADEQIALFEHKSDGKKRIG